MQMIFYIVSTLILIDMWLYEKHIDICIEMFHIAIFVHSESFYLKI